MKNLEKLVSPLLIITAAVGLRLISHMPNFAPISAMALFGGAYLGKRWALIVPIVAMLISDYLVLYINPFRVPMLGFSHIYAPLDLIHGTTYAVYGSFLISGLVGLWLRSHKNPTSIAAAALFSSLQFFLITNAAVWLGGGYNGGLLGLWESYVAGLPFFRGTLFGDFFYTGLFFGGFEALKWFVFDRKKAIINAEVKV